MQSDDNMKSMQNTANQCQISAKPEITESHEARMRWFILVVLAIGLLASLSASIVLTLMTRNPLALALPSSVLLIVLPIIRYLYGGPKSQVQKSVFGKIPLSPWK